MRVKKFSFFATKKLATLRATTRNVGKSPQTRPSQAQNRSKSKISQIFEQLMNKENISIRGFMGKIRRGKSSCLSKIKQEKKRKQREYPFTCSDALSNNTLYF